MNDNFLFSPLREAIRLAGYYLCLRTIAATKKVTLIDIPVDMAFRWVRYTTIFPATSARTIKL